MRRPAFGMTGKHENVGGGIFSSEDGIHWSTTNEAAPVDLKNKNRWDTHHNLRWDARLGRYLGFTRGNTVMNRPPRQLNRTVARFVAPKYDGPFEDFAVVHVG